MKTKRCLWLEAQPVAFCWRGQARRAERPNIRQSRVRGRKETLDVSAPDAPLVARVVSYGESDVVAIKTKLRYTTLLILPKTEQILDFTCGDKEYWVVNGNQNFAYVKPAKAGAQTNLNLVTASGNVYSFVLTEVSEKPQAAPDLKIFVELKDDGMAAASRTAPEVCFGRGRRKL